MPASKEEFAEFFGITEKQVDDFIEGVKKSGSSPNKTDTDGEDKQKVEC